MPNLSATVVDTEFDRQLATMLTLGYPALAGQDVAAFVSDVEACRPMVAGADLTGAPSDASSGASSVVAMTGRVPFVLVPTRVPVEAALALTHLDGAADGGVLDRNHGEAGLAPYRPISQIQVPDAAVYVLHGVERGEEFCSVPPRDAVATVLARGRTPLTVAEGIALITQVPALLQPNRCFMLAGSRSEHPGLAKRVPALWISGPARGKAPKLGWCWDGNPHTWLGTASAAGRC